MWLAWPAFHDGDVDALIELDEEITALRPSSSAPAIEPRDGAAAADDVAGALSGSSRLERLALARGAAPSVRRCRWPLPRCARRRAWTRRASVEAFAYTRLAATISAAMRLMPIGQTDAHRLLAAALERVPACRRRDDRRASAAPRIVHAGDGHRRDVAAVSAFEVVSIMTTRRPFESASAGRWDPARRRSWMRSARRCASATGWASSPTTSSRARTWSSSCAARRCRPIASSACRPAAARTRRFARTRR